MSSDRHVAKSARVGRSIAAAAALLICLWGVVDCARAGWASILYTFGQNANRLDATAGAVLLNPADPETHYAHGLLLADAGRRAEAVQAVERAVAARPRDYVLWLELGGARERAGDQAGAVAAYRQAARLAPYYAQPRWELGNLLFRMGRREEAYTELRRAVASDPTRLPALMDFIWVVTGGDAAAVEQAVRPETNEARLALARFFARRQKTDAALALFSAAGGPSKEDRRALVNELIAARQFDAAYEAWAQTAGGELAKGRRAGDAIFDGSFEQAGSLKEPGFGWQITPNGAVSVVLDDAGPHTGRHSLRLDWSGESDPNAPVVSQLVPVEPHSRYRLSFAARTQDVVTGGAPVLSVLDGATARTLAQSAPLPQGTSGWQARDLEFVSGDAPAAVRVCMQRLACNRAPCPAFGRIWLDDVSLRKF